MDRNQERKNKPTSAQAKRRAQQNFEKRKRQYRNRRLLVLFLLCVVVLVSLSVTVFFNIKKITVSGNTKYQESDLINTTNIRINDNMFRKNMGEIAKQLKETYPYIESVKIKRKLPDGVSIEIQEGKEVGAVESNGKFVIVSGENRILQVGQTKKPPNVYLLKGVEITEPIAGQYLQIKDEKIKEGIKQIFDLLQQYPIGEVSLIDLTNQNKIAIEISQKKRVILGDMSQLEYKFKMVQEIVGKKINPNESVIIDATTPSRVVVTPAKI